MPTDDELMTALLNSMTNMELTVPSAKIMIYGNSGVGKTVASMQLAQKITPPGKRVAYIDALNGWVSLVDWPELRRRTVRFQYQGIKQIELILQYVEEGRAPFDDIATIVIDEHSKISKMDLDVVLESRAKKDPTKDRDVPTQPDMYANTERMRRLSGDLIRAKVNVIFIAHTREDEVRGIKVTSPGFMPKFSQSIREDLHVVGHMVADERNDDEQGIVYVRRIQLHPTKGIVAKTRIKQFPVHVSVDELATGVAEWLTGKRGEYTKTDPAPPPENDVPINVPESDDTDLFEGVTVE